MTRAAMLAFLLCLAAPLAAQTTGTDSDAGTTSGEDSLPAGEASGEQEAADEGIDGNAVSTVESAGPTGVETGRPVPASPDGIKGLEDPDAAAFSDARQNNNALLADRQAPDSYPTLDAVDDDGGALDGAATGETLGAKADDPQARALFTALAAQNCRIAARDVADTLGPQGFDPQTVTNTLATLYVEGAASLDAQGYLQLPAALCPPDRPAPSPRDTLIAAMRDNGCSADEATIRAAPGISDLSDAQLLAILGPMRERGEIETGTLSASLSQELCQED